jgi:hypothetical protein
MKAKRSTTFVIGGAVVLLLTVGSLGSPAGAEKVTRRTYPSKESFKLECELLEGSFSEYTSGALNGVSRCDWGGGSYTQCDVNWSNPNNCEHVSVFIRRPERFRLSQTQNQKVAQVADEPVRERLPKLDRRSVDDRHVVAR